MDFPASATAETAQSNKIQLTAEARAADDGFYWTSAGWMRAGDPHPYRWTLLGWVRADETTTTSSPIPSVYTPERLEYERRQAQQPRQPQSSGMQAAHPGGMGYDPSAFNQGGAQPMPYTPATAVGASHSRLTSNRPPNRRCSRRFKTPPRKLGSRSARPDLGTVFVIVATKPA